jgi:hypothetical protein
VRNPLVGQIWIDADHDGDIDIADFAYLQRVFVAP